jgi:hypothetical protein
MLLAFLLILVLALTVVPPWSSMARNHVSGPDDPSSESATVHAVYHNAALRLLGGMR